MNAQSETGIIDLYRRASPNGSFSPRNPQESTARFPLFFNSESEWLTLQLVHAWAVKPSQFKKKKWQQHSPL